MMLKKVKVYRLVCSDTGRFLSDAPFLWEKSANRLAQKANGQTGRYIEVKECTAMFDTKSKQYLIPTEVQEPTDEDRAEAARDLALASLETELHEAGFDVEKIKTLFGLRCRD